MQRLVFLLLVFIFLGSCQSKQILSPPPQKSEIILDHTYFKISYDPNHKLAKRVSYQLSASHLKKGVARRQDKFFMDPLLVQRNIPAAKPTDYRGSGFDRGHMAPSDDFIWSQEANDTTFVMSNMAPQSRSLNRGSWKTLEGKIRKWACTEGELQVVTGPILEDHLPRLPSQISIPKRFYKVVYDLTPPNKAIAFVFDQSDTKVSISERAASVHDVEQMTGEVFLNELSQTPLEKIKKTFKFSDWKETDCEVSRQRKDSF